MNYRKFKADYLFDGHSVLDGNRVLVTNLEGQVEAILPFNEAGDDIEAFKGILSPGFINCHCHLELSHMKGLIPEKTGLVDFLLTVMKQRHFDPAIVREKIVLAEEEMLNNGIVAVGDICNTTDTIEQKQNRHLYYHNFIEATGFTKKNAADRFNDSRKTFDEFAKGHPIPLVSNSIVPHAPYSVSKKLFEMIADFPGNQLLTIHNQEAEAENELYLSGTGDFLRLYKTFGIDISSFTPTGKRSLESWLPNFYKHQSFLLVHNVATNEEDIQTIRNSAIASENISFCLCPNANLYISGTLPDIGLLLMNNFNLVIGTDSLASNHQLDILEELKTLQLSYPGLDTKTLLQWATFNGAKALGLQEQAGSFEKGRQPGIILIENINGEKITKNSIIKRLL